MPVTHTWGIFLPNDKHGYTHTQTKRRRKERDQKTACFSPNDNKGTLIHRKEREKDKMNDGAITDRGSTPIIGRWMAYVTIFNSLATWAVTLHHQGLTWCVLDFHMYKLWYGRQCLGYFTCIPMLHAVAHRDCTKMTKESLLEKINMSPGQINALPTNLSSDISVGAPMCLERFSFWPLLLCDKRGPFSERDFTEKPWFWTAGSGKRDVSHLCMLTG